MTSDLRSMWTAAGGVVPEDWDFKTIESLLVHQKSIAVGVMYPGNDTSGGVPLIKVSNIKNGEVQGKPEFCISPAVDYEYRRTKLTGNELLITLVGEPGDCAIVSQEMKGWNAARAIAVVRLTDPELRSWLRYVLLSKPAKHLISARLNTTVQKTLNLKDIKELGVPIPPKSDRERVTIFLSLLDKKINLNRRINQTLEAMAQAIFKSWFVDFDPVKAKIAAKQTGQDPLRAAMSAISGKSDAELDSLPPDQYHQLATTAALFPDEMEESALGEVPKGWACGALGDICSFTAGSAFKPEHQGSKEGDYPFIKVSDMNLAGNEVFILMANNYVSEPQRAEMNAKLHPLGATVFAKIGVALISNRRRLLASPTIIDNNMMTASPVEGISVQYFLYSLLSTIDFNTLVSGTALPYLNVSDLKKIPIVRPPYDACCAFEASVSSMFSMMKTSAVQSTTLATTRDALLPKLLSGEIELSETFEG